MHFLIFWSLMGVIVALTLKFWIDLDFNRVVFNHTPGNCDYVEGIDNGSHGIFVLSNGLTLITSGLVLRAPGVPHSPTEGRVFLYDATMPDKKAELLQIKSSGDFDSELFRPSDITCWEEKDQILVYIVDTQKRQICVFDLNLLEKKLVYLKSLTDPLLTNPNDIVAISKNELYVSNFGYHSNPVMLNIELALQLSWGSVFYFNGSHFDEVLSGLNLPDGIALSANKLFLYVTLLTGKKILFHKINQDKSLSEIMQIPTDTQLDNLVVDRTDRLWIASQPVIYKGLMHTLNPFKYKAPSQVIRVTFHRKGGHLVEEVFSDDGDKLRFASSVAVYGNVLILGTLYEKPMWCRLTKYHSTHYKSQIDVPPQV